MAKNQKNPFPLLLALLILLVVIITLAALRALFIRSTETPEEAEESQPKITAPNNEYHPDDFYYDDGFLRYQDCAHLVGIDVSVHQGMIDWQKVSDAGVDFAIIRAGYRGSTVGDLYEDEQFRYNLEEAINAGIQVGIYFFSQALTPEEAVEEARYACSLLEGAELDLPIYYDWEFIGGRVSSISDVSLTECAIAFCEEIEAQGYQAGVYFNQDFGYSYLNLAQLQEYHLWLAEYGDVPSFRYHFDCLQYTDSGSVNGIETAVDLDILFLPEEDKAKE